MTSAIDHEARAEIRQITAEQSRIAAVIEALRDRIEREGNAHTQAMHAQARALEALAAKFGDDQVASAFLRGKDATRWATIGFAVSFGFMVLGGLASWLFHRAFGG